MLIRPHSGETPVDVARRYLKDASKAWTIEEYNRPGSISNGEASLIPRAPFRLGGLSPEGYQVVPVLAYADLGHQSKEKQTVSRTAFHQQMHRLKSQDFSTISPSQLKAFMEFTGQLPRRSVLITFDTTSRALVEIALPILKKLGYTATVFVTIADVGRENAMNWDQIRQLHGAGFTIACRGYSGRSLTDQGKGQSFAAYFKSVESELILSRGEIEAHLGEPCLFLAYPQGGTNSLISAMVAKLGFSAAFTLSKGENPFFGDRFTIHRSTVDGLTSLEQFGQLLTTMIAAELN